MALPVINQIKYTMVIPSLQKTVEFTPYNVKQEKNLMIAVESNSAAQMNTQIKTLITECVNLDDVNVNDLPMFDIETIFLNLRCRSVGEGVKVNVKCESCDESNELPLTLNSVTMSNDTYKTANKTVLLDKDSGVGVTLCYPTLDSTASVDTDVSDVENTINVVADCIETIFTADEVFDCKSESRKEVIDFIESLNSNQFAKMSEFFNDIPSVKLDVVFNCSSCDKENKQEVKGLTSFFT
jgi:hypothetical protein